MGMSGHFHFPSILYLKEEPLEPQRNRWIGSRASLDAVTNRKVYVAPVGSKTKISHSSSLLKNYYTDKAIPLHTLPMSIIVLYI
jgi:hypothetical protein